MQRLDLGHPGKGQLVIGPLAPGYDGDLVVAGALERPVVIGSDILDRRKRVAVGIDDAFEHGHSVSTSDVSRSFWYTRGGARRAFAGCNPDRGRALPASSDVICGIRATP